jgi:cyanophycinase
LALLTLCCSLSSWGAEIPGIANVIMGGAEHRCSSFSGRAQSAYCSTDWDTILAHDPAFHGLEASDIQFESKVAPKAFTYSFTSEHIDALGRVPVALFDPVRKTALLAALKHRLQADGPQSHITGTALDALVQPPRDSAWTSLTASELAIVRTAFVDTPGAAPRKLEARSTLFTSDLATVAITNAFVAAARAVNGGNTPLIGVVTASANGHPFLDRDINVFALMSAGANVVYLPLEGGYRQALDANDCDNVRYYYDSYNNWDREAPAYHADLLYPDLSELQRSWCANHAERLNATLQQINGIYFSGGNQTRHLHSLRSVDAQGHYTVASPQLAILQKRHAQGQLVVAGTSAGNHIQGGGQWRGRSVPMLSGGDSIASLLSGFATAPPRVDSVAVQAPIGDDGVHAPSIQPEGGAAFFPYGVLDSHFSRRAREGRLIRAVYDSGMDYGFGVDENTALLVSQADSTELRHFSVVGAGGVFIADLRQSDSGRNRGEPFAVQGVCAHYLRPGDTAHLDAAGRLHVTLSATSKILPISNQPMVEQDRVQDYGSSHFLLLATRMGLSGAQRGWGSTLHSTDKRSPPQAPPFGFTLQRGDATEFRGSADGVSYTALGISITPWSSVEETAPAQHPNQPSCVP